MSEWNDATIERLRDLWARGVSTAEIGRQLNVSKNAIVGKAHRLNLPPRPSPIRRLNEEEVRARMPAPKCVRGPTLPVLPSVASVVEAPPIVVLRRAPSGPCVWPLGDPRDKKNFRFCGAAGMPGSPYCLEHAEIAYVRVHGREEDAA